MGSSSKSRLAALLPLLCMIHCVGTAVLATTLPAAALWLHSAWLEAGLALVSVVVIGLFVLRRPQLADGLTGLFLAAVALGVIGWAGGIEWARHGSLLMLIGVQALWLRERRRVVAAADCACHGHAVC